MPERSPAEAVEMYRQSLQRILSCITDSTLVAISAGQGNPYQPGDHPRVMALSEGRFAPLSGDLPLSLQVIYRYEIAGVTGQRRLWEARTREYTFSLAIREQERRDEIVAYHWQPDVIHGNPWPHLHIGPVIAGTSNQIGQQYVHRMHFPTGLIPLSSVIRLAIEEFGARPLRDDWQQVLVQEGAA